MITPTSSIRRIALTASASLLCAFGSCSLDLARAAPDVARFALVAERPQRAPSELDTSHARLDVRPFHPVQPAASGQFVYRVSESQFVTDFYRGYVARPELLITHAARAWLAASGATGTVLPVASRSLPTHVLEADLLELHVDFRNPTQPVAVVALRYVLLSEAGVVTRTGTVRGSAPIAISPEDGDQVAVPKAQGEALSVALTRLEQELSEALGADK